MNTILSVPFKLSQEDLRRQLAIKSGSSFDAELSEFIIQTEKIARPKALYRISYIELRGEESVTIDGTTFNSTALSINTANIQRVFPFIATCGIEVDSVFYEEDDIIKQYWLNTIKLNLLQASLDHLRKTIQSRYLLDNLVSMNPGSGDASVWPIEEQSLLFSLLGSNREIEQQIGVQLLPSYLMVPEMSVSGILFPSETSYQNCQLCQREDCPGRRAHFDPILWAKVQGNN